jgi:hypothetical protein
MGLMTQKAMPITGKNVPDVGMPPLCHTCGLRPCMPSAIRRVGHRDYICHVCHYAHTRNAPSRGREHHQFQQISWRRKAALAANAY